MNLLEQLGIDPATFVWQDLSLCVGMEPNLFYDLYEGGKETARQVDEMCLRCPVMKECAKAGMDGEYGVFGAIYWNGAGRPDVNRNDHKTDETWARIKERLS